MGRGIIGLGGRLIVDWEGGGEDGDEMRDWREIGKIVDFGLR